jgi:predicted nuclease with TOPRIM domain
VSLEAVETLRRDLADMAGNRAQESEQMHSEMAALGLKVRECLQTLAQLPEGMESFADQMLRIDQQYQPLLPALDQMSSATSEITQKMADLGRDYALLQEEFHQAHDRIRALEDRFDGMNPRQQADADNALPVDMYCIRKNLDEIRDFMADLSRKL